ncbi:hypothetical protein [Bufonid herpesvirus 1]|uniref:hypothetical protein n=1 Tax=Bufonid herpesvirus 1 TaxID=2282206 RepID=UPI000EB653D3|nr:hypothetical protein [Bufonid herpesvirus 1]AXF48540.1 hypothetical protein [Bufonid herpesvirus 1]
MGFMPCVRNVDQLTNAIITQLQQRLVQERHMTEHEALTAAACVAFAKFPLARCVLIDAAELAIQKGFNRPEGFLYEKSHRQQKRSIQSLFLKQDPTANNTSEIQFEPEVVYFDDCKGDRVFVPVIHTSSASRVVEVVQELIPKQRKVFVLPSDTSFKRSDQTLTDSRNNTICHLNLQKCRDKQMTVLAKAVRNKTKTDPSFRLTSKAFEGEKLAEGPLINTVQKMLSANRKVDLRKLDTKKTDAIVHIYWCAGFKAVDGKENDVLYTWLSGKSLEKKQALRLMGLRFSASLKDIKLFVALSRTAPDQFLENVFDHVADIEFFGNVLPKNYGCVKRQKSPGAASKKRKLSESSLEEQKSAPKVQKPVRLISDPRKAARMVPE